MPSGTKKALMAAYSSYHENTETPSAISGKHADKDRRRPPNEARGLIVEQWTPEAMIDASAVVDRSKRTKVLLTAYSRMRRASVERNCRVV